MEADARRPGRRARVGGVATAVARLGVLVRVRAAAVPRRDGHRAGRPRRTSTRGRCRASTTSSSSRPGLMAASAVMQAAGESLWPVMGGVKWMGTYHAAVSTPVELARRVPRAALVDRRAHGDVGDGLPRDRRGARRRAVVLGRARDPGDGARRARDRRAAVGVGDRARRATPRSPSSCASCVFPLFLFSGTFFPVSRLPDWLEPVALLSPLYHAVELCRAATTGSVASGPTWSATSSCCSLFIGVGCVVGQRTFERMLTQ